MLTRSSLETQKLELMSEVTNLKFRQTSLDKENMDLRKRLAKTLDLSTAATAALAAAASAAASNQNQQLARGIGNNIYQCTEKNITKTLCKFNISLSLSD